MLPSVSPADDFKNSSQHLKNVESDDLPPTNEANNRKRSDPQNPFEFLKSFYTGRTKSLTDSTIRRIKANGLAFDPDSREAILLLGLEEDDSLDKTRSLMLIAIRLDELKPLGDLLIDFASELICRHTKIRTNGIQAKLFPGNLDDWTLDDAWAALLTLKNTSAAITSPVDNSCSQINVVDEKVLNEKGKSNISRKSRREKKVTTSADGKVFRNAYLCSVVWRIHKKRTTFSDSMRSMRNSIFHLEKSISGEDRLIEAIALMPEKEDAKVALIWDWQVRQQADAVAKLAFARQENDELKQSIVLAEKEKINNFELTEKLVVELESMKAEIQRLSSDIGVVQTHGNADQEILRASSLRVISDAITNLDNVVTALGRDPPKTAIALDVLNTVVDGLRAAQNKLGVS